MSNGDGILMMFFWGYSMDLNGTFLLTGWWYSFNPLKNMTSSVGMMKFPRYGKNKTCSKPPTNQFFANKNLDVMFVMPFDSIWFSVVNLPLSKSVFHACFDDTRKLLENDLGFSSHCKGTKTPSSWLISAAMTGPLAQLLAPFRFRPCLKRFAAVVCQI